MLVLFVTVASHAANIQGTVLDANNQPVANQIVYVTDSTNAFPSFSVMDTTDAAGFYSVAVPSNIPNGTTLKSSTYSCGVMLMHTHSFQGSTIISNFYVCATPNPGPDTVSGIITVAGGGPVMLGSPAYPAIVYLIKKYYDTANNDYILTALDSTNTSVTGVYAFQVPVNNSSPLLVKAALLPNTPNYMSYLPTYYGGSLSWSTAVQITSFAAGANSFHLIAGTNPGGPGFIGGSVAQEANKTTGVGDPLGGRIILLTTASGTPVAYTYSNSTGHFSFSNFAYGTYKLMGDVMGKTNPPLTVVINGANPAVTNVKFEENSNDFTGIIATAIRTPSELKEIKIFPNPATHAITFSEMGKIGGDKRVIITDLKGTVVLQAATDEAQLTIPVTSLTSGLYMVRLITEKGEGFYEISKW